MIAEIYDIIVARINSLAIFTGLGAGLTSQDQPTPSARVFLASEKSVDDKPSMRQLTYTVEVAVGHNDTAGASQREISVLLDKVRDAFQAWRPTTATNKAGFSFFSVPEIAVKHYADHDKTIYHVAIAVQAWPGQFA